MIYDLCVIGGGIVGLASALKFGEVHPGASILLLEKEEGVGRHQTGHNSGVIHSGIYYAPGSFRAELSRQGVVETIAFCEAHGLPYIQCGKLIVATNEAERVRMDALFERSKQNKVPAEKLDAAELRRREPNIDGVGAIWVPSTGIVGYKQMCAAMADDIRKGGGEVVFGAEVTAIAEGIEYVTVSAGERQWRARQLIVCGGLQSDRLARMAGVAADFRVVPFRGEYYQLPPEKNDIVHSLIYPVPDPALPFLGIHLTRMIDGSVTVGPNAVLGWAREGYRKFSFSPRDSSDFMRFPGFWRFTRKHLGAGLAEMRNSLSPSRYLAECQKYCPSLTLSDLLPYEAGIRAQVILRDGTLLHDFLFEETPRMLHVCNAPSPAATSSLPIGRLIVERVAKKMTARLNAAARA
ncbi:MULTISPECIES: L-2-hydroxyglutarate oxidase [Rhodomicrobium]|uniref:L-2-hydroxyglutarate oxidase n=1 Tax=Rhodomicrobium TaxID=1068 RepID=UPI000B4B9BE5|nr:MULTISPECIES: L-2-hydroxyglutarate oxidase [Rhodomicrobium]